MKKLVLSILSCLFLTTAVCQASPAQTPFHGSIGVGTYYHEYKEPGIMKNDGFFYALNYSLMYEKKLVLGIEGTIAYGQVDYSSTSSGESSDIDDVMVETRGIIGFVASQTAKTKIIPYTGFAYRFLQDDSENKLTSTNHLGYLRESNYYYSPIGIKIDMALDNGWHFKPTLEYDIFWFGEQESFLGYVAGYEDIKNDQEDGYGWRASIAFTKKAKTFEYGVELFYRFWDIDDSEVTRDSFNRNWIEPDNETTEFGINLSLLF